jgi:hypothetical protein
MYHPAAGLHNQQLKDVIREDFRQLPRYVEQALQATHPAAPTPPAPEDPVALLDAYAALVAPATPAPSPPVDAPPALVATPEAVAVAAAPSLPDPAAEASSVPVADAADVVTEPPVTAAPAAPVRRPRARKPTTAEALPSAPENAPELEQPTPVLEPAAPVPDALVAFAGPDTLEPAEDTATQGATAPPADAAEAAVVALFEQLAAEPPPATTNGTHDMAPEGEVDSPPAPLPAAPSPARKKGKTAPPAEQLSLF